MLPGRFVLRARGRSAGGPRVKESVIHALHVLIFEEGNSVPVVEHVFRAKSRKRAIELYNSHVKTDTFLRDCVASGRWQRVRCSYRTHWRTQR